MRATINTHVAHVEVMGVLKGVLTEHSKRRTLEAWQKGGAVQGRGAYKRYPLPAQANALVQLLCKLLVIDVDLSSRLDADEAIVLQLLQPICKALCHPSPRPAYDPVHRIVCALSPSCISVHVTH